jgi:hypothetical protein
MIYALLIFWHAFFEVIPIDYPNLDKDEHSTLVLELVIEKDTFLNSEPILLTARVQNKSQSTIYVPKSFVVTSNLLPNGESGTISGGGLIKFQVQPISPWLQLHIENTSLVEPVKFIKLKPNQTYDFKYDLGRHFKTMNQLGSEDDSLQIRTQKSYLIQATYENIWEYKKQPSQTFKGKIQSNQLSIFLKQD